MTNYCISLHFAKGLIARRATAKYINENQILLEYVMYGRFANAHIKQNLLAPFLDIFLIRKVAFTDCPPSGVRGNC